jgi:hypothetical protein
MAESSAMRRTEGPPLSDEGLLEDGPTFDRAGSPFDPAQQGYTLLHNYALYFWRPYLGNTAFALWELLVSFCYRESDSAYPSISRLARMLTNSDHSRAVVTGRRRRKRAGQPRYLGALGVLRRELLVQVTTRGEGRAVRYTFRVRKQLPLLRPHQVARLSPCLQRDHAAWLQRYGIDRQAYHRAFDRPAPTRVPSAREPEKRGEDQGTTAAAPRSTPAAPGSTKNPQEEAPYKQWWGETVQQLRTQLDPAMFGFVLCETNARSFQEGVLTVKVRSETARDILQRRLVVTVRRTLLAVSDGQVQQVHFTDEAEPCAP